MGESIQTTVVCQALGDGSGDVIIDLHPDVLRAMNIGLGDVLSIELADGAMVLKPIREDDSKS
jgi:antitoxin ChpS